MKNIITILLAIVFISGTVSCDKVKNPVVKKFDDGLDWTLFPNGDSANYNWPTWTTNTNTYKNVLLEDFTGHTCTNCPAAGAIAKQQEDNNPGRIIVASIHASSSGSFQALQLPEFVTDFTTPAGDAYATQIKDFIGNPAGMINRQSNGLVGSNWYLSSTWTNESNIAMNDTLDANLQLQYNYFPSTRGLFVHTETEFKRDFSGTYNLIVYLVRDTVIAAQKLSDGTTDDAYHHHSVLTDNINGTWGTQIISGDVISGDKYYNNYSYKVPDLDSTYSINNLSLITYLCNRETFEVLQVIKTELKE